jgi:hypothetical protein
MPYNISEDAITRRFNKLRKNKNQWLPVTEAVHNAIEAVLLKNKEDSHVDTTIEVHIKTSPENRALAIGVPPTEWKIESISIKDQGVGFIERYRNSFDTAETVEKMALGCQGQGRTYMFAAFEQIEIESVISEKNIFQKVTRCGNLQDFQKNEFEFEELTSLVSEPYTKVVLKKPKLNNYKNFTKHQYNSLISTIFNSCRGRLISLPKVKIAITSNAPELEGESYCLESEIDEKESFSYVGKSFDIIFLKTETQLQLTTATAKANQICLCAGGRPVKSMSLLPSITGDKLPFDDGSFYLYAFVKSDFLDEIVDSERYAFDFSEKPDKVSQKIEEVAIFEDDLNQEIYNQIKQTYEHLFKKIQDSIDKTLLAYKETDEGKIYQHLLENEEIVSKISNVKSNEEITRTLEHCNIERKHFVKETVKKLMFKGIAKEVIDTKLEIELQRLNQQSLVELAGYVLFRKEILNVLEQLNTEYDQTKDGKQRLALEAQIHNLICFLTKMRKAMV